MEKTDQEVTPDLKEYDDVIATLEEHLEGVEGSLAASQLFLVSREISEDLDATCAAPLKELKAKVQAIEKATLPTRKRAKAAVDKAKDLLTHWFREEKANLDARAAVALAEGDHEALCAIPDSPALAEGLTYSVSVAPYVLDISKVPQEYLSVDLKRIAAAIKDGVAVPGIGFDDAYTWRRVGGKSDE